jgi:hypothetical protein
VPVGRAGPTPTRTAHAKPHGSRHDPASLVVPRLNARKRSAPDRRALNGSATGVITIAGTAEDELGPSGVWWRLRGVVKV